MVLGGHVTAAGGRIHGSSVWSVSLGLARRIWWPHIYPSLSNNNPLHLRSVAVRRFRPDRQSPQLSRSCKGAARRDFANGNTRSSGHGAMDRASFMRASAVAQGGGPVAMDAVRTARNRLQRVGIALPEYIPGDYRVVCPECSGGTSREKSLSVTVDERGFALWNCFRGNCGWSGPAKGIGGKSKTQGVGVPKANGSANLSKSFRDVKSSSAKVVRPTVESLKITPELSEEVIEYFLTRQISRKTLQEQHVMQVIEGSDVVVAFPYIRDGEMVNCKFRTSDKKFWQVKGAEKVLYGLDDIKDLKDIIIVEGEMDKLTLREAGFTNCVSVPDGAPARVSEDGPLPPLTQDKKYEYLHNCRDYFQEATRIVLATDADEPGQALAEELARRLGRERCWRVKWPARSDGTVCKDANEVLYHLGPEGVRAVIETAELYPIRGLFRFSQFFKELDDYYYLRLGDERGVSTGWQGLDDFYRVVPGELTVVTGVPNSGKSEWIDALLCNLSQSKRWTFALCSMENKVREHGRKLLEKYLKQPFFDAPYANSMKRMNKADLDKGKQWLNENFFLIRCEDDELPSVDWVLNLAKAAVMRHGIRGLVIDPYNELDHQRPSSQTETEYVSQMLTRVKRFAQHHDCHVWFVAHPKQLQVWKGEAPGLYDISGSAHFINKCDNGIVIHRNRDPEAGPLDQVKVLVRKVRNKAAGSIGEACLNYNRATGEYSDVR